MHLGGSVVVLGLPWHEYRDGRIILAYIHFSHAAKSSSPAFAFCGQPLLQLSTCRRWQCSVWVEGRESWQPGGAMCDCILRGLRTKGNSEQEQRHYYAILCFRSCNPIFFGGSIETELAI